MTGVSLKCITEAKPLYVHPRKKAEIGKKK